ncbi:MAG: hypothetical protein ACRBK7_26990 [Acidimicrobiales bacterium]
MKKTLATIGVVTATAFAGMGLATMASAQTADDGTTDEGNTITEDGTEDSGTEDRDGRRGNRDGKRGCNKLEGVAEILGLEVDELQAELEAGSSLAEIAEANGVDPDALVDQMVADATERVEAKVAEGRITEDEAADKLAEKSDRIEDRVFGNDDADADSDEV